MPFYNPFWAKQKTVLTITGDSFSFVYGAALPRITYSLTGVIAGVSPTGTITVSSTENGETLTQVFNFGDTLDITPGTPLYNRLVSVGNHPYTLIYSGDVNYIQGEYVYSNITVTAAPVPGGPDITVSASVTPGSMRVGGGSFWATLIGYGNADDADDEESTWVDFGSGTTNNGIGYFFKQELAGGRSLVMAGFPNNYTNRYATITVNGTSYTTQIVTDSYNYKAYGGGSIDSVAAWADETLWANILNGPENISISISVSDPRGPTPE